VSYEHHAKPKPGANEPCHCGSGRKYKRCHREADISDARLEAPVRFVAGGRIVGLVGEAARNYRKASKAEQVSILADIGRQQEARTEEALAAAAAAKVELREAPPADEPLVLQGEAVPGNYQQALGRSRRPRDPWWTRLAWGIWWPIRTAFWRIRVAWHARKGGR
jgi:hypothetical protein